MHKLQSKRLPVMSWVYTLKLDYLILLFKSQNKRVHFIDIWYTYLTSVYYNLEDGLAIVTESFGPLDLDYPTSFVKFQTRSDEASHTIPDTVYLPCALNWAKLVCTDHSLN